MGLPLRCAALTLVRLTYRRLVAHERVVLELADDDLVARVQTRVMVRRDDRAHHARQCVGRLDRRHRVARRRRRSRQLPQAVAQLRHRLRFCPARQGGPIYKISYDLAYDYRKFIAKSTYGSDLERAEISLRNIVS